VGRFLHVLEELGLGRARVTAQQHVDVTAQLVLATRVLGLTTEEQQCNGTLDVLVAVDGGRNTGKYL
jgi:hypothetical protein